MGLLTCTLCGCAITAERKKSKYVYYHCTNFGGDCANTYIREEKLGILLGDVIKPRFTSPTNSHVPRLFLRTHPSITLNPIVIASAPTPMDGAWIAGARCPGLAGKHVRRLVQNWVGNAKKQGGGAGAAGVFFDLRRPPTSYCCSAVGDTTARRLSCSILKSSSFI